MATHLRVLLIEDSEDDALLIIHALKKGGYKTTYEKVEHADAMRHALVEKPWDVILCDYRMPKFNGRDAIALLKETGIDLPLIIVSGAIGEETAVECMRLGAHDYVMKKNLSRLAPAIERELKEAESRLQRKQAEQELLLSEERFKAIFDQGPVGIAVVDSMTGHICTLNPMFAKIAGRTMEEMAHIDWMSITHPDDVRETLDQIVLMNARSIDGFHRQMRYLHPDGATIWISMATTPLTTEDKLHPLHLCMIEDITERKHAEEALRDAEMRYRLLFEHSPDGIVIIDPATARPLEFNETAHRQLGYSQEEFSGISIFDLEAAETPEETRSHIAQCLHEGRVDFETQQRTRQGEIKDSHVTAQTIEILGQSVYHCIWRDITTRKRAEKILQETLESLRKAVGVTIQVMVAAVEKRDPYTAGHQSRSADLARAIAAEMGWSSDKIDGIRIAASIHDIGKLSIPAEILSKPTRLNKTEFLLVTEHARQGFEILEHVQSPWPLAEIVYQHHERMDGSGYPRHLKGDDILLESRILAVADVVEAIASHRPYRPALGIDAAMEEISKNRGILYDPGVTDACLRLFQEKQYSLD